MTLWLDAQISPAMAVWLRMRFDVDAVAVRDVGLRDAEDGEIYTAAKAAGAVVMTKDSDFVELLERHGAPPQIIWLRSGNTSNTRLKQLLTKAFPDVWAMIEQGEPLVEVGDRWKSVLYVLIVRTAPRRCRGAVRVVRWHPTRAAGSA